MILTGRHVPAQEGYELGFVSKVVPQAKLMDEAKKWAEMILSCSPVSIRTSKAVVGRASKKPTSLKPPQRDTPKSQPL